MGQIVLGTGDLRFVGLDLAQNLRPLLGQGVDDQWLRHAPIPAENPARSQMASWCICYLRPEQFVPEPGVEAFAVSVLPG